MTLKRIGHCGGCGATLYVGELHECAAVRAFRATAEKGGATAIRRFTALVRAGIGPELAGAIATETETP